ncbi:MAG: twin transmembrane helix small protein [Pseudomonadota bacterium]
MDDPFLVVVTLACFAVVGILAMGLGGFGKGGEFNRRHANRLMRYRIAAQFVAVLLILGYVAWRGSGG